MQADTFGYLFFYPYLLAMPHPVNKHRSMMELFKRLTTPQCQAEVA